MTFEPETLEVDQMLKRLGLEPVKHFCLAVGP